MDWGCAPSPSELCVWLAVASPGTVSGRYRWTSGPADQPVNYGWVGETPVVVLVPPDVDLSVFYRAPGAWRLDLPAGPLARSCYGKAVLWEPQGRQTGRRLQQLMGPDRLVTPDPPEGVPDGTVVADELLGRACWRWRMGGQVRWVDEATGCLLRLDAGAVSAAWSEVTFGQPQDPATYELGEVPGAQEVTAASAAWSQDRGALRDSVAFAVPWWPDGCDSRPVAGDLSVPSLLVELGASDGVGWWVGVAPAGTPAPVRRGKPSRRWDGDGVSLSLSWQPGVPQELVDQVAESMPRMWS